MDCLPVSELVLITPVAFFSTQNAEAMFFVHVPGLIVGEGDIQTQGLEATAQKIGLYEFEHKAAKTVVAIVRL